MIKFVYQFILQTLFLKTSLFPQNTLLSRNHVSFGLKIFQVQVLALINTELIPTYEIKLMTEKLWTFFHNKKTQYFYTFMNNYWLVSLRKLKDFYGHIDSFCSGLPNIVFFILLWLLFRCYSVYFCISVTLSI